MDISDAKPSDEVANYMGKKVVKGIDEKVRALCVFSKRTFFTQSTYQLMSVQQNMRIGKGSPRIRVST